VDRIVHEKGEGREVDRVEFRKRSLVLETVK
jgi:hypothetical protein